MSASPTFDLVRVARTEVAWAPNRCYLMCDTLKCALESNAKLVWMTQQMQVMMLNIVYISIKYRVGEHNIKARSYVQKHVSFMIVSISLKSK